MANHYYIINKPYGMLSQFRKEAEQHRTLAELYQFPKDVYPVGRLDRDSEGLLILTNDKRLNARLLRPEAGHWRTYWAQVEGRVTTEALNRLQTGVSFKVKKKAYRSLPAKASLIHQALAEREWEELSSDQQPTEITNSRADSNRFRPAGVQERNPPVRYRKSVADAWLELQLREGKNRQVRKMCAAVGHPVLRLLRVAIGELKLEHLAGQTVREVEWDWLKSKIFSSNKT